MSEPVLEIRMVERTRIPLWFVLLGLLLMPFAACSGDGGADDDEAEKAVKADDAVVGSFVGEVSGTKAFVAVVAAPAVGEKESGAVQIYVSDGRRLSEWFSGPISDNSFVAKSGDGDAEATGELSDDSVTGTVELSSGKTVKYQAGPPSGAAGLYELTVSSAGELSGASAAGLGVTGEITLGKRGTGMLRLVDGKRLEFDVVRSPAGDLIGLRAGQLRLIVLPSGELKGAGKSRPTADGSFFIRSSA
jgi:hypothetical protein